MWTGATIKEVITAQGIQDLNVREINFKEDTKEIKMISTKDSSSTVERRKLERRGT